MDIWRMEDARGRGPFTGAWSERSIIGEAAFEELLKENIGKSKLIAATVHDAVGKLRAGLQMDWMEFMYGRKPVFGAPDRECFERWFPLRFRKLYAEAGYYPVIYDVPDELVRFGASAAECMFIPEGEKRRLDPVTLEELVDDPVAA